MVKKTIRFLIIMIFGLTTMMHAQQNEKAFSLSLDECIQKALENNLGIAVEILNPELAGISISLTKEKFMPQFSISYNKRDTNSASYSWIEAAENITSMYNDYSAQITQLIPTGGSFVVSLDSYKNDTNRSFQTINPRYGSTLRLNFSQPLLKNFGYNISRKEIIVAKNNKDISENNFKKSLQDTIYSVEESYWNLVYSIENLKVRQQSLELAKNLLEKNKKAVEIGTMAPIEILNAQAEVATREADILEAEALVKNNEDRLKTIMNLQGEFQEVDLAQILPKDQPAYEKKEVSLEDALVIAMENRPDLQSTRIDLKNKEINLSYAKNQLLPDLSLQASYWSPGISGDQIIYLNNNPLTGIVIGKVPGGSSDALSDAFNFRYKNWSVGLTLSVPINSVLSRASYAQARVNLEQSILKLKNQEQQIFLEIKNSVRAVQTNYKRVQAYKAARELAETKLNAEEEKFKVGLSTNYLVLQYQRDLANAQTTELRAIIDYNLSLARLSQALGITLKEKNVTISNILGN
ncbi:MAG: TolC family protein [Candidatus Aminicenantes bacterium]|nr:TolC family protein [Candidatus Aminicenantes bacterium]